MGIRGSRLYWNSSHINRWFRWYNSSICIAWICRCITGILNL